MPNTSRRTRFARYIARLIAGRDLLAAVSSRVDDSAGWFAFKGGPNDRDAAEIQKQYGDTLKAWRKNPMAKRMVDTITDYTLGDGMLPSAPGTLGTFIKRWWNHPKNRMEQRLPELSDELTRAGDLFITLHRNPEDGISYLRPIPKDRIQRIETLDNDWETEIAYYETRDATLGAGESRKWLSPSHPDAAESDAIMVHYAINKVVGALMGESDLTTMIPWLLRYSRLMEDRVRLHWAARAFLWIVTVPSQKVAAKMEQYRTPPSGGSVIVKDDTETWESVAHNLQGFDTQFDLRALRQMIDAGSGLPPHWRGEAHDVSLATAEAMEHAASRHLRRRQLYLKYMLIDLCHVSYTRAWEAKKARRTPKRELIQVTMTDIDRDDNRELATAARTIAHALRVLRHQLPGPSTSLQRLTLKLVTRFAGEPLQEETVDQIMDEAAADPWPEEEVKK